MRKIITTGLARKLIQIFSITSYGKTTFLAYAICIFLSLIDLFNKFYLDKRMCMPAVLNSIMKDCRTPKNCHRYVQDVKIYILHVYIYVYICEYICKMHHCVCFNVCKCLPCKHPSASCFIYLSFVRVLTVLVCIGIPLSSCFMGDECMDQSL